MEQSKTLQRSLTIWGALVTVAAQVGAIFGYQLAPDDQAQLITAGNSIATGIGAIMVVKGRLRATQSIRLPSFGSARASIVPLVLAVGLGGCATAGGVAGGLAVADQAVDDAFERATVARRTTAAIGRECRSGRYSAEACAEFRANLDP